MNLFSWSAKAMRSKFLTALLTVLSGSVIAQSIPVIASIFIARIFTPDEFGIFAAWLGLVMISTVGITLRLEKTFVILADESERTKGFLSTVTIIWSIAALGCGIGYLISLLTSWSLSHLFLYGIIASGLTASTQAIQSWLAANGYFSSLSIVRITQTFFIAIFQITLGLVQADSLSMIVGYIFGHLFCILIALFSIAKIRDALRHNHFKFVSVKNLIIRHKKFPIFSLPADLLNALTAQFPVVYLGIFVGSIEAGVYAMAVRVLGAPIGLFGAAVLDVFKREAAIEYRNTGLCKNSYKRTFKVLLVASGFMVIGVYFLADIIFVRLFGPDWSTSAQIAILLLPMFAMRLIASPLSYIVYIADRQQVDLMWQILLAITTVLVFLTSDGFLAIIQNYALAYAALYIIYLYISYNIARSRG